MIMRYVAETTITIRLAQHASWGRIKIDVAKSKIAGLSKLHVFDQYRAARCQN